MTTAVTRAHLAELERNYAKGVLRVREGDTWLEFQSRDDMKKTIDDLRIELNMKGAAPQGSRRVSVRKGY